MAMDTYLVRYAVAAPPAYRDDPHQRLSIKEHFVLTDSPASAVLFVKQNHLADGKHVIGDVEACLYQPPNN